ncbi:hypothetical protein GGR79_002238 [Xanthomonas arboricola]|nr:hypothetical protein [Xanthomonas arboricola]
MLTLWIFIQGYRIVTGQSREAAMGLVVTALRAALIIGLATSMAKGSPQLYWTLTEGISSVITQTVMVTVTLRVLMRRSVYCGW